MMLPAAALADEAAAPQLLLRAWVHEAMRTVADRSPDHTTLDTATGQVGACLLVYKIHCAEPELARLQLPLDNVMYAQCRCRQHSADILAVS
jgi:hypothetical protein